MSQGINRVTLYGNLGADAELKTSANGTPYVSFRIATNEVWNDKEGAKQERTSWHRVVYFGGAASVFAAKLKSGASVYIDGRIATTSYEKDGQKKYSTDIVASFIQVCSLPREGANGMARRPPSPDLAASADAPF